jgi:CubicO group peptidase (beta-lactamase class C family)
MKRIILITVVFFALTSCKNGSKTEITENEKQKDSLTAEINQFNNKGVFNGFAVSIVNDKGTLYQQGFGFADIKNKKKYTDSTIQNIASISKTFVGLALLKVAKIITWHNIVYKK